MKVNVSRLYPDEFVALDVKHILKDSVMWYSNSFGTQGVNPGNLPCPVLKCQIPYSLAVELGLSTNSHAEIAQYANIFIYAKYNKGKEYSEGYQYLCALAGPKPTHSTGVPAGQPPCTKKILQLLGTEKHLRADIRKQMLDLGYAEGTIRRAFKRLENTSRISFSSDNHSLKNCEVWTKLNR